MSILKSNTEISRGAIFRHYEYLVINRLIKSVRESLLCPRVAAVAYYNTTNSVQLR